MPIILPPQTPDEEPSLADHAAPNTTPQTIESIANDLQRARASVLRLLYSTVTNIDDSPYFAAINSCVYDLFQDHRGTVSAKAWILS
jgi:hypothetical protein